MKIKAHLITIAILSLIVGMLAGITWVEKHAVAQVVTGCLLAATLLVLIYLVVYCLVERKFER